MIAALYQLSHRSASVASLPALRASEFEQFKVVRISFPRRERLILCTSSSLMPKRLAGRTDHLLTAWTSRLRIPIAARDDSDGAGLVRTVERRRIVEELAIMPGFQTTRSKNLGRNGVRQFEVAFGTSTRKHFPSTVGEFRSDVPREALDAVDVSMSDWTDDEGVRNPILESTGACRGGKRISGWPAGLETDTAIGRSSSRIHSGRRSSSLPLSFAVRLDNLDVHVVRFGVMSWSLLARSHQLRNPLSSQ